MSYDCQHIIRFEDQSKNTRENLEKLARALEKHTEFDGWSLHNGNCITDSFWNCGAGLTWYTIDFNIRDVSNEFPGEVIEVYMKPEDHGKENLDTGQKMNMLSYFRFGDGDTLTSWDSLGLEYESMFNDFEENNEEI